MNDKIDTDKLLEYLAENKIELIISAVTEIGRYKGLDEIQKDIILISARFNDYKRRQASGILNFQEDILEISKIRAALSLVVSNLDNEDKFKTLSSFHGNAYYEKFKEANPIKKIEDIVGDFISKKNSDGFSQEVEFILRETISSFYHIQDENNNRFTQKEETHIKRKLYIKTGSFLLIIPVSWFVWYMTGLLALAIGVGVLVGILIGVIGSQE